MKPRQEIVFNVEEAEEGGYIAEALGEDIITEADTLEELRENMREAVVCHFSNVDSLWIVVRKC
ncbi:MAG: 2-oxoisovalerate dehydrogenase [bacterium]|jgi:predicted RNase H-like HicB family nuclease